MQSCVSAVQEKAGAAAHMLWLPHHTRTEQQCSGNNDHTTTCRLSILQTKTQAKLRKGSGKFRAILPKQCVACQQTHMPTGLFGRPVRHVPWQYPISQPAGASSFCQARCHLHSNTKRLHELQAFDRHIAALTATQRDGTLGGLTCAPVLETHNHVAASSTTLFLSNSAIKFADNAWCRPSNTAVHKGARSRCRALAQATVASPACLNTGSATS